LATQSFRSEFQELIRGSDPANLHAIVAELAVEEGAIRQWRVRKTPVVRMALVEIANARQEPAALEREAARQSRGADVGFLERNLIVGANREIKEAGQRRVDVGSKGDFGLAKRKAAFGQPDFIARREAGDRFSA